MASAINIVRECDVAAAHSILLLAHNMGQQGLQMPLVPQEDVEFDAVTLKNNLPDILEERDIDAVHSLLLLSRGMGLPGSQIPQEGAIKQLEFDTLKLTENRSLEQKALEKYKNATDKINREMAKYVRESLENNPIEVTYNPKRSNSIAFSEMNNEEHVEKRIKNNEASRESRRKKKEKLLIMQYETEYKNLSSERIMKRIQRTNKQIAQIEHELAQFIHPDQVLKFRASFGLQPVIVRK